jgi:hypothetical protein
VRKSANEPLALLLGAGFSRWAAGLPVVSNLFDTRFNRPELGVLKRDWDRLHPQNHPEMFIHDVLLNGTRREKKQMLSHITQVLSAPFVERILGGTQTLMIDDKRKLNYPGIQRAQRFVESVCRKSISGIVTPNYDLLIEYALGTSGFNYGVKGEALTGRGKNPWFLWQGSNPRLLGEVRLAKIHGSISWTQDIKFTDGRCGLRGDALIVPPVPEKTRPPNLKTVWNLAGRILRSSKHLLVFGFAFNPYDRALLELLTKAGGNLKSVLLVDINPPKDRARDVWPEAKIATSLPPRKGSRMISEWLANLN